MKNIRPITDLRKTNEISDQAHLDHKPIFITKNGYSDLVVMSQEYYDSITDNQVNNNFKEESFTQASEQSENMGFIKVACATIDTVVADVSKNSEAIIGKAKECAEKGVKLLTFSELTLTGYTCQDLFLQNTLLNSVVEGVKNILIATKDIDMVIIFGAPVLVENKCYNAAIVALKGKILGIVPKTALPNYNEFYELRHFAPAPSKNYMINYADQYVPFGNKLLFRNSNYTKWVMGVEICEDLWIPNTPSTNHAIAGATIICNLSASNEIVGKKEYREMLVSSTSARLVCAYLYCSSGNGESTTDLVFSGANIISENGSIIKKSELFTNETIITEIDLEKLVNERQKMTSYPKENKEGYKLISFDLPLNTPTITRKFSPTPFIPSDEQERYQRAMWILKLQVMGLVKRVEHTHAKTLVIGLSGGLDSTLALLVTVEAMKECKRDLKDIHAITMPCFGTSKRTKNNAYNLANGLGVTLLEIDITAATKQHLKDIGQDENDHSVTFENAQARERTQVLMDYANKTGGLVVGTGDLSELALGWATYNGDHMSNYGVNCSIPKTLVKHIVYHYAKHHKKVEATLLDILDTPVSPELLPLKEGEIAQKTEEIIGPYELHDFFLYHLLRNHYSVKKIYFLAKLAFNGYYDEETIKKWLNNFIRRFFLQQFKRSCLPDGVKVGSVSLSPRGDLRMPSDASSNAWLKELGEL
mgnify:FL=1